MAAGGHFRTTRWTVVRSARARNEPGSAAALAQLCETYWYPLYAFVRRLGHDADEARDLTQGFFLLLLERDFLANVKEDAGRFRSFLLASVKHYLANVRRGEVALKRGGGQAPLSLDLEAAERRYDLEPADDATPESIFERRWALEVIERVGSRLRESFAEAGKERQFALLAAHVHGDREAKPYREIAKELMMSEAAVKMAVSRMRRQFGKALRDTIADTVDDPAEVDAEIRYLLAIL